MKRAEIEKKMGKPILKWIIIVQCIFILTLIVSPFILIWGSLFFAWRLALTGMFGTVIMAGLYHFIKFLIKEAVDDYIKN